MWYEIASNNSIYKGMDREISLEDFKGFSGKVYHELVELYLAYAELICRDMFFNIDKAIEIYRSFKKRRVDCELIVFDSKPITNQDSLRIAFLGIDIVHKMSESLLAGDINPAVKNLLNINGLCDSVEIINKVIPYQDHGKVEWDPCYVYKVIR